MGEGVAEELAEDEKDTAAKTHGHRLLCGQLSGEAVQDFMDKFPASDAPERNIR